MRGHNLLQLLHFSSLQLSSSIQIHSPLSFLLLPYGPVPQQPQKSMSGYRMEQWPANIIVQPNTDHFLNSRPVLNIPSFLKSSIVANVVINLWYCMHWYFSRISTLQHHCFALSVNHSIMRWHSGLRRASVQTWPYFIHLKMVSDRSSLKVLSLLNRCQITWKHQKIFYKSILQKKSEKHIL